MPNLSDCPSREELNRFALGDVAEPEAQTLEQHLADCEPCLTTLCAQANGDTLVEALRGGPKAAETPQHLIEAMVARIGTLRQAETEGSASAPLSPWGPGAAREGRSDDATHAFDTPSVDRGRDTPTSGAESLADATSSPEELDFLAPAEQAGELGRLGGYRILQILGSGGMGVVFVGEDPLLQRKVALKVMRPALAASKAARQRFQREARLAASIEHDHLVHIYQVGEDRTIPFLAMQLLKGETLEERLRNQESGVRMPVSEAIRIGREIADGLSAAHARGLIHRDIKPANVFLEDRSPLAPREESDRTQPLTCTVPAASHPAAILSRGERATRVKILDFGLARAVEDDAHITGSGVIAGTPNYMAPEQARAETLDARTDLFSLGCVLYRMLTGRTPFRGTNSMAVLNSLANDQPAAPAELNAEVPAALSDYVMRLLAKNPAERPSSARAVAEELQRLDRGDKLPAGPPLTTTAAVRESPLPPSSQAGSLRLRSRRWLVAAAVLLGFIGGGWYLAQIIIRLPSELGELVVEIMDKDLEAIVGHKELTLRTVKHLEHTMSVLPGDKVVIFKDAAGNEIAVEKLTLKKGKQVRLRAWMEPRAVAAGQQKPLPPGADANRRAAEWVLSLGGSVYLDRGDFSLVPIANSTWLPSKPFLLKGVDFQGNKKITDAGLANLRGAGVTNLNLIQTQIGDVGMEHVGSLTLLENLQLGATHVTDKGLDHLKGLEHLDGIGLSGPGVTEAGLIHLRNWPRLQSVHFYHVAVADRHLEYLAHLKNLRVLGIVNRAPERLLITDEGMKRLKSHSKLESLMLNGPSGITDVGLQYLKELRSLKKLQLAYSSVTGIGLGQLKSLEQLGLWGANISDAGLAELRDLKLVNLHLSDNPGITDAGLDHLVPIKTLALLDLRETKVSTGGVKKLAAALPKCTIESDHGTFGPAADPDRRAAEWVLSIGGAVFVNENSQEREIRAASELPRGAFEFLGAHLNGNRKVTDAGLANLKDCTNLKYLQLGSTEVGDAGLTQIKNCRNVTYLTLTKTRVTDAGLANFKDCKNVTTLELVDTQVSDVGMAYFKDCKNLLTLRLDQTRVSDTGLAHFKDCKNLSSLQLAGPQVTDAGLAHFQDCKKLTSLYLHHAKVSDAGLAHFKDCKNLAYLYLALPQVSDAAMVHFKDCKNLTQLSLGDTQVGDAGLTYFKDCRNLTNLYLDHTKVSDAGLSQFKDGKNLDVLDLSNTQTSDTGLDHFASCLKLSTVKVKNTKVTEAGVKKLSVALPNCRIESDHGTFGPAAGSP